MPNINRMGLLSVFWERHSIYRQRRTRRHRPGGFFGREPLLAIGLLALCLLGLPQPVVAQPAASSILVLRVNRDGRYQAGLTRALTDFLGQTGATLVRADGLRGVERKCDEPECMTRIAEDHGASVVLAANIERHGGSERLIRVWLYEVRTGRDQQAKDACNEAELDEHLKTVAGRLVNSLSEPRAVEVKEDTAHTEAPPPSPPLPLPLPLKVSSEAASQPHTGPLPDSDRAAVLAAADSSPALSLESQPLLRTPRPRYSAWRRGLGGSLAVLGVLSLGGAIALTVLNGHPADGGCMTPNGLGLLPTCKTAYMPLFVSGYAASGALLLGTVLTFSLR